MTVEVDDAQVATVQVLGHRTGGREADGVVTTEHDRQRTRGEHVPDTLGDLVERLLDVARDREDVADIRDRDRLSQVDTELEVVRAVQRGDLPDALRPEPRTGTVGGAAVERGAEHHHVVLTRPTDVLDVRRLQKGVDAGKVWQLPARERGDPFVHNGVRAG